MMKNMKFSQRIIGLILCMALFVSHLPLTFSAAEESEGSVIASMNVDPSTADSWENMMGTGHDGNRYAGRVWVDKSLYNDGDIAILNSRNEVGSSFKVSLKADEAFQVIFSALGSTMATKSTVSSTGPMDVVLVIDNSVSMNAATNRVTRMEKVIDAANDLLNDLLTERNDVRLGIAAYGEDASTILPFGTYNNGVVLKVNSYTGTGSRNGVITAYNKSNTVINKNYKSNGYANYTNTQAGFDLAMQMLANATDTQGRKPFVILLTDGAANTAVDTLFTSGRDGTVRQVYYASDIDPMIALSTLLSAAYNKAVVTNHYGKAPMVYGIGVDLSLTDGSNAIIDPANNFNNKNVNAHIREAYDTYIHTWLNGKDVQVTSGTGSSWGGSRYTFRFGHDYLKGSGITDRDIAANINYVDSYYPVTSSGLSSVFDQIYQELSSGVFNPITSTTRVEGSAGTQNTPLIYVDFIGQHMEIKELQAITLFGSSYSIIKRADGSYVVDEASGVNPTTGERWNTAEDIVITVTEQENGCQKLEIKINQEILPILLEQVEITTLGGETTATITELRQDPLRVMYTVGIDSDVLLPNGEIDVTKIQGYSDINDAEGTVDLYGGRFGVMNPAENGVVTKGDSHVGFKPSKENRYYYYQTNQSIFVGIKDKNGNTVTISPNNEYGIEFDENLYDLVRLSYEDYLAMEDDDVVYNYVTYYRPTADTKDGNAAEEVTYLVYTNWSLVKESITFVDATTKTYLNDGKAIAPDQVESFVAEYLANHPDAELYAVLGVGSIRTSRLHNMTVNKETNESETAEQRYTPEYTYDTAEIHNGNDVVVWSGNNGKLTVDIKTGIRLTKSVTEAIGQATDRYALTVTVPEGVEAEPEIVDAEGNKVPFTYENHVITVRVMAGQTVYVSGIPGGTVCDIGEIIDGDYYIESKTDTVRIPYVSEALNGSAQYVAASVTNAPHKYGSLYITKTVTSDHAIPTSVLNTEFSVVVNVGASLAGKKLEVEDMFYDDIYTVTVDDAGNMTFKLKARQTLKINGIPAGTAVTVTETNPGENFAVSYETRDHSGEAADNDNQLVIPTDGNATAVVYNRYTPTPVVVKLDIAGTKNFIAEGNTEGGKFVYKVQAWNGSKWVDISGKTAETPYAANESGTKTFTIADVLSGIEYNKVGSYAYQVIEVKGNVPNVTYDRTVYTFNVIVTDNGGRLVATVTDVNSETITDGIYEVTFNNTYHTAPVSLDIKKIIDNQSGDNTVSLAGFEFRAVKTNSNWTPIAGENATAFSIFTDAAGEARFTSVCTKPGTYYFLLTEVNNGAAGWTYSAAEYRITVTVTENDGNLTASLDVVKVNSDNDLETAMLDSSDATRATVSFVNTYDPEDAIVDLDGYVFKELTGKPLTDGMFEFFVYADGDRTTPILTGVNKAEGNVSFIDFIDVLVLKGAGVYHYDVIESIPSGAVYDSATGKYVLNGMSYDATIYDLTIEVVNDSETGKLVADFYFEDSVSNKITFRNSYKATETSYTVSGLKILRGRAVRDNEFSFGLYLGDTLIDTVTNKVGGAFTFKPLTYTEAGTYTYVVKELVGQVPGVTYDGVSAPITVTVTVTDHNGVLIAEADVDNADITFTNTYTAKPASLTFDGRKFLKGGELADNAFSFLLYQTDSSFDIAKENAELIATATNADGAFTFGKNLDKTGSYYFVVVEDTTDAIDGIVYDRSVYRFVANVTDAGNGQLMVSVINLTTDEKFVITSDVHAGVVFENATFDAATEKEVYLGEDMTTEIDGQKVKAGDILTYYITYVNYTGEDVVVNITDVIPAHTTYVDSSASHNGSYAGTHVNWILNVAKDESVTVSFKVEVNETDVIVANTATVRDGVHTYETNTVKNHTVDNAIHKDVYSSEDSTLSINGEQVNEGDELIYTITFINPTDTTLNLTLSDLIPTHTTYVDGSADRGGIYADGKVEWQLEVEAWGAVTVSFRVTVNDADGSVTIENVATATDGENEYQTNLVTNYTVEEPIEDNPDTADHSVLLLWGVILTVSCGALTVAKSFRKKYVDEI